MTFSFNMIVIGAIVIVVVLGIYYGLKKDLTLEQDKNSLKYYQLNYLTDGIKETITMIQNTNIAELNLNREESKKREKQKAALNHALRYCSTGDLGQKEYIKDYITEIIQKKYNIQEETIDFVIPFHNQTMLTATEKFDLLLYDYQKRYKELGFYQMCQDYKFEKDKIDGYGNVYYSIDKDDIEYAYSHEIRSLSFVEKLDIVTQRIYQNYAGHGIIDVLREEKSIDGIAGGVSGSSALSYDYMEELLEDRTQIHSRFDAIWIFFHGKPMRLEFMSFGSERELERVTHNLYRHGNPGWMSSLRGFIINDTKDGNRITCARRPFCESFGFWIRKFDSMEKLNLEDLLPQTGSDRTIGILKYLVKGMTNFVISGETNCGKTTLLKALVQFIDPNYPIRTLELFFELWLSKLYPEKNIVGVRETESITTAQAISFLKKTDASVIIAGESADFATAAKVVELCTTGTKMTMSTNHSITTEGLIEYHTNAVMAEGFYRDDFRAERSVASALNFDVHMVKSKTGERYLERITEIIPTDLEEESDWPINLAEAFVLFGKKMTQRRAYTTKDIIIYEDGKYVLKNQISDRMLCHIRSNLTQEEYVSFSKNLFSVAQGV